MSVFTFLVLYRFFFHPQKASRLFLFCYFVCLVFLIFFFLIIFTPTSCSARVKCASGTISSDVSIGRNFHFIIYRVVVIGNLLKL